MVKTNLYNVNIFFKILSFSSVIFKSKIGFQIKQKRMKKHQQDLHESY